MIVVFGLMAWDEPRLMDSSRWMALAFAELGQEVLYVNPPQYGGWPRTAWVASGVLRARSVHVSQPTRLSLPNPATRLPGLGSVGSSLLRLEDYTAARQIGRLLPKQGEDLLYVTSPRWGPAAFSLLDRMPGLILVYDVFDDHTHAPTSSPLLQHRITTSERSLLQKAALVLAVSSQIQANLDGLRPNDVLLCPNAIQPGFFSHVNGGEPSDLASVPRPRVMFVGNLYTWIDYGVLVALTKHLPETNLVLVGPEVRGCVPNELRVATNCVFLGPKPIGEIGTYMHGADCLILPAIQADYFMACDPLKMREYLASGVPIVASNLPAFRSFAPFVKLTTSQTEFIAGVKDTLITGMGSVEQREERVHAGEAWSWTDRAEFLLNQLSRATDTIG